MGVSLALRFPLPTFWNTAVQHFALLHYNLLRAQTAGVSLFNAMGLISVYRLV